MKHLRKSILTLLALTLFGGAWAQNSWQSSSSQASYTVALADVTVTFNGDWSFNDEYAKGTSNGQTITIAPTADGDFMLVFGGSIGDSKPIHMMNNDEMVYVAGTKVGAPDVTVEGSGVAFASGEGVVYALEAGVAYTFSVGSTTWRLASFSFAPEAEPAEIKLTPDATGKVWTLAETPDYDLDLQVVYYQKYALKDIPANWQVKVDGVDKTAAIDHDSLKITETAQVLLTPDHPERVKKVILVDEAVLVNIDGITLDITGCTTWADIIARNPGVIRDWKGRVESDEGILSTGGLNDEVYTSYPYDPAQQSVYHWEGI